MSPQEQEPNILSYADSWAEGTELRVASNEGLTIFVVHQSGESPKIDIVMTPEGNTSGPLVSFLGSVASRKVLEIQGHRPGVITQGERLVIGVNDQPLLLSGITESVMVRRTSLRSKQLDKT